MQLIIKNLCITLAVLITLVAIPGKASDRNPNPNETSVKASSNRSDESYIQSASNHSNSITQYASKEGIIKSLGIRLFGR